MTNTFIDLGRVLFAVLAVMCLIAWGLSMYPGSEGWL